MTESASSAVETVTENPRATATDWALRAAWAAGGAAVAWPLHWFKYSLPGQSPAAVVGAVWLILLVFDAKKGLPFRWGAFLVGALAFGACVVVRPWADPDFLKGHLWRRFEAQTWRDASYWSSERLWMIDDYLDAHSPVGRPLAEIDALLGKDDLRGQEHLGAREWGLGPERGFIRIDSETLVLEADERGTVTRAYIYRD